MIHQSNESEKNTQFKMYEYKIEWNFLFSVEFSGRLVRREVFQTVFFSVSSSYVCLYAKWQSFHLQIIAPDKGAQKMVACTRHPWTVVNPQPLPWKKIASSSPLCLHPELRCRVGAKLFYKFEAFRRCFLSLLTNAVRYDIGHTFQI